VPQQEILGIPFPSVEDTCDKKQSNKAFKQGVKLIDRLLSQKDELLQADMSEYMRYIDKIVYSYFGLSEADVLLIEDTLNHVIPSMQPRARSKNIPNLWKNTNDSDWETYSKWLSFGLTNWLEAPFHAAVELVGASSDLVVVSVHLSDDPKRKCFENRRVNEIDLILPKIWI